MIFLSANYCPNPFEYETDNITTTKTSQTKTAFPSYVYWKCKDRRYLIKKKSSTGTASTTIAAKCNWSKQYSVLPADLECVLTYCDNPIDDPNSDGTNHNFQWNNNVVPLTDIVQYPCKTGMRIENSTSYKYEASSYSQAKCGSDGEFRYPTTWPQCSNSITCSDPGNSDEVTRSYISGANYAYNSTLKYVCTDPRKYIKVAGSGAAIAAQLTSRCEWKKTYPMDGTALTCTIHHCSHPHSHPGKHDPPAADLNLNLVIPTGWSETNWHVSFGSKISYKCDDNMFIEVSDPIEIDPSKKQIDVNCIDTVGVYNTPVKLGGSWPNCTKTVSCGPPPDKPTNGFINAETGFEGTITWLNGVPTGRETYNTSVQYACVEGSKFDTNSSGGGDSTTVQVRCQWNKFWHPYSTSLPPCLVTHCTKPFPIPYSTLLEEINSAWTPIKETKKYQCKDQKTDGNFNIHTRFWESDRSKSTFEILCKEDGSFDFDNDRDSWPTCIQGNN